MSKEIDWSKAPKGTEAALPGSPSVCFSWFRRDGIGQVQQICPEAGVHEWTWMGGRREFPAGSVLRTAPWPGEYLPSIGTVCEVDGGSSASGWGRCTIQYSSPEVVVFRREDQDFDSVSQGEHMFRPVRTAEQIVADEKQAIIDWLVESHRSHGLTGIAGALHAEGYRKQVHP